jgi:hypothetical protein
MTEAVIEIATIDMDGTTDHGGAMDHGGDLGGDLGGDITHAHGGDITQGGETEHPKNFQNK